jgi:flagellar motor switch/type III secretory pathway protein FliN
MTTPLITAEIIAAFRQGAGEAAEAWKRTFETAESPAAVEFSFQDAIDVLSQVSLEAWNNPGVAVIFPQAVGAIVLLVADPVAAFPAWLAQPDATGKSKLATLALELGMIALPATLAPTGEQAIRIENLQEALLRCQPAGGHDVLPLTIKQGEATFPAMFMGIADHTLLMPPAAVEPAPETTSPAPPDPPPAASSNSGSSRVPAAPYRKDFEEGIPALPPYTRSLLKIQVPIVASLATTQLPVGRILEIGPGSIIQFDQSCEQPLSLAVGDHPFAVGEAVKVGEKFGLRITSMVMPAERFWSVRGRRE